MLFSDVDAIAKAASNKAELCNNHFGKYFMRSIMAGFYIVVATIFIECECGSTASNLSTVW